MKIRIGNCEIELTVGEFFELLKGLRLMEEEKVEEKKEVKEVPRKLEFDEFESDLIKYMFGKGYKCIASEELSREVVPLVPENISKEGYYVFEKRNKHYFIPKSRVMKWALKYGSVDNLSTSTIHSPLSSMYIRIDLMKDIATQISGMVRRGEIEGAFNKFMELLKVSRARGTIACDPHVIGSAPYIVFDWIVKYIRKSTTVKNIEHEKIGRVGEEEIKVPKVLRELMEAQREK